MPFTRLRGKTVQSPPLSYWITNPQLSRDSTPIPQNRRPCSEVECHLHLLRRLDEGSSNPGVLVSTSCMLPFAKSIFAFYSGNRVVPRASHRVPQSTNLSQARSHLWNQRHIMLRPTLIAAWVSGPNFWSAICSPFPSSRDPGPDGAFHGCYVLLLTQNNRSSHFQMWKQGFRTEGTALCKVMCFSRYFNNLDTRYHSWSFFSLCYVD